MGITVDAPFPHRDDLGEGPVWDTATDTLVRVDVHEFLVHRLDPATGAQHTETFAADVGFAVPATTGELVVAEGRTLVAVGPAGARRTVGEVPADDPYRINDGKADTRGRLLFGTINLDWEPAGSLYRFAGGVERMSPGVTISNGLGWDDARARFYYVDSATQRIDVFDWDADTGTASGRRPFVEIPAAEGLPDGMAVDAEGGVWLALFRGAQVRRYDPEGLLSEVVTFPTSCPTSIAFGGPDLRTAYVTSGYSWLDEEQRREQPLAGALFVFDPGVAGHPVGRVAL
jgi:sugar lactone lactonase YvrE